MIFLIFLFLSSMSIASAAAFFSIYGLAYTFQSTFWSVVIMGITLEAGKLVAASYLYRYWNRTHALLKTYLILGIVTLMFITSTGIFGYLSAGYQSGSVPLEQGRQQIQLLDQQLAQAVARKQQIDAQIANLPPNYVNGRLRLMKGYQADQDRLTAQINDLNKQVLDLKQKQIEVTAHTGPIIYIAEALGISTTNASTYIIFLIMFAFDPMALALTLALNNAIKIRQESKVRDSETAERFEHAVEQLPAVTQPEPVVKEPEEFNLPTSPAVQHKLESPVELSLVPVEPAPVEPAPVEPAPAKANRIRPYSKISQQSLNADQLASLLEYRRELVQLPKRNADQTWELQAIDAKLREMGFGAYITGVVS